MMTAAEHLRHPSSSSTSPSSPTQLLSAAATTIWLLTNRQEEGVGPDETAWDYGDDSTFLQMLHLQLVLL
ncbi:hypothetical protein ILYODFUR_035176 [Ilyodon furcidens]|uniref:Uncharacterized protein n=1 Tax=Ilyodon furcidens TaxID=33524 RepID=A0ABV0TFK0_9TELE